MGRPAISLLELASANAIVLGTDPKLSQTQALAQGFHRPLTL